MIKQSIRLVGCIIALFALILVFKHSHLVLSSLTEPVPESGITAFRGWSLLSAVN